MACSNHQFWGIIKKTTVEAMKYANHVLLKQLVSTCSFKFVADLGIVYETLQCCSLAPRIRLRENCLDQEVKCYIYPLVAIIFQQLMDEKSFLRSVYCHLGFVKHASAKTCQTKPF